MSRFILSVSIYFVMLLAPVQRHKVILQPPPPAETQRASGAEAPPKKHFDAVQVQREARELSDLARSIPLDVEHVNKGLMPKDIVEKLKRIEKLSKQLRTEVAF